jgi:hypothetical protein
VSTRHLSARGWYPFIEPNIEPKFSIVGLDLIAFNVLDISIIINGVHSGTVAPIPYPKTALIGVVNTGTPTKQLTFRSTFTDGRYWQYSISIPVLNTPVYPIINAAAKVRAVYIHQDIWTSPIGPGDVFELEVEPSRVQWYVESVGDLAFKNITRCNSVEDVDTLYTVLDTSLLAGDPIQMADGYNTTVTYENGELHFQSGAGLGLGRMPNLGNTDVGSCPEPDITSVLDSVLTINGLLPVSGDIPLQVSQSLYIDKEQGQITIRKKQGA